MSAEKKQLKIAILDLYACTSNQGMRGIRKSLQDFAVEHDLTLLVSEFEVRMAHELPGADFDIYISSGGPGSPLEQENADWEKLYFAWLQKIVEYNRSGLGAPKSILFICHSFQMACRYFKVAKVTERKSQAFGLFPVHCLSAGQQDTLFKGLPDPFYAVDSRDFQVIQPDFNQIATIGAAILAIEKARPHVPLERAIMAMRFNEYMVGTQFHPEADAIGMLEYLHSEEKKKIVIENHSEEKWASMVQQLNDPDNITLTFNQLIPNFLKQAIRHSMAGKETHLA